MKPFIYFKGIALIVVLFSVCAYSNECAVAQEVNQQQLNEATTFFNQLVNKSDNPIIKRMAGENLSKLNGKPATNTVRRSEIALLSQSNNNSIVVPTMINGKFMGTFIVDTGATYTVITPMLARKMGVEINASTPRINIITANGPIKAPLVTLESVKIGQVEVKNVQAVVQDLGNDVLLAGLLGMNCFKDMEMTVRQDRLILTSTVQ